MFSKIINCWILAFPSGLAPILVNKKSKDVSNQSDFVQKMMKTIVRRHPRRSFHFKMKRHVPNLRGSEEIAFVWNQSHFFSVVSRKNAIALSEDIRTHFSHCRQTGPVFCVAFEREDATFCERFVSFSRDHLFRLSEKGRPSKLVFCRRRTLCVFPT